MHSRYPGLLGVCNVILLIASTTLMYLGASMLNFYLLDKFSFLSQWFEVVPYLMIGIGVASFVVSIYGFYVTLSESRCNLIIYSCLMAVLFIGQLVGIFSAIELRGVINRNEFSVTKVSNDLENYKLYPSVREKWDALHREFGCCGALNFNNGYEIWRSSDIGIEDDSVPDSCCLRPSKNCGRNILSKQEATVQRTIYTHGCVTVVEDRFKTQIVPVLLGYAGVSVVLALMQIMSVVFACSYASAINRYSKDSEMRSLRSGAYQAPTSAPSTPRFDHVRGQFGHDNMTNVWVQEQDYQRKDAHTPMTDMLERDV